MTDLAAQIDAAWENRAELTVHTQGAVRDAVDAALALLDSGEARVAEPVGDGWQVNQWLKKAVLLSFRLTDNQIMDGPGGTNSFDHVPIKLSGRVVHRLLDAGFREVPGGIAEALDLLLLGEQVPDRVEHEVDEGESLTGPGRGHVAERDGDPLGSGLLAQAGEHRLRQFDPGHLDAHLPQRERDPAGADRELEGAPAGGELGQAPDRRPQHLGREHPLPRGVVRGGGAGVPQT